VYKTSTFAYSWHGSSCAVAGRLASAHTATAVRKPSMVASVIGDEMVIDIHPCMYIEPTHTISQIYLWGTDVRAVWHAYLSTRHTGCLTRRQAHHC
jgi:hypothetical protein